MCFLFFFASSFLMRIDIHVNILCVDRICVCVELVSELADLAHNQVINCTYDNEN